MVRTRSSRIPSKCAFLADPVGCHFNEAWTVLTQCFFHQNKCNQTLLGFHHNCVEYIQLYILKPFACLHISAPNCNVCEHETSRIYQWNPRSIFDLCKAFFTYCFQCVRSGKCLWYHVNVVWTPLTIFCHHKKYNQIIIRSPNIGFSCRLRLSFTFSTWFQRMLARLHIRAAKCDVVENMEVP